MNAHPQEVKRQISIFSEFSALSFIVIFLIIVATLFSFAFYIWMAIPPEKTALLIDDANLFSKDEAKEISSLAKKISREKDVNVLILTVQDKGRHYGSNSESESIRYAQDQFKERTGFKTFRDNSGVLVLMDMEYRFFYIVTYGTAKASISDAQCQKIYNRQLDLLRSDQYSEAILGTLKEIYSHNFTSALLIFTYLLFFVAPILAVGLIVWRVSKAKRNKYIVNYLTYLDSERLSEKEDEDIFIKETVSITYISTGSSGGGGGGYRGGGGGGGRSGGGGFGGGGGRF